MGFSSALAQSARLTRERFDLVGRTELDILIPAAAKAVRLHGMLRCTDGVDSYPRLTFGAGGSVFSAAGNYVQNGGWAPLVASSPYTGIGPNDEVGCVLVNSSPNGAAKIEFDATVDVERPSTAQVFLCNSNGVSYAVSGVLRSFFSTYLKTTPTTQLRLDKLRITKVNGGPYTAGSYIWADWLG